MIYKIFSLLIKLFFCLNDDQFGQYLAGLIDGVGHFTSKQQLDIVFHTLDASLAAYYLKQ